jgi:hydroxymethylpyrimidine/phosphomethylpyrimidine kinase
MTQQSIVSARRTRRAQGAATIPIALSIAGSDSSAGAGIQADLKTFSALGVYGLSAVTCVVAEIPGKVLRIQPVSAQIVREQIEVLFENFPVSATKTGLLYSAEIISVVAGTLGNKRIPLVVDPVMVATSGDVLLESGAVQLYEQELFPIATLITPNLNEASELLGEQIRDRSGMEQAVRALGKKYGVPVLLKGGHLSGNAAIDLLFYRGKIAEFVSPFIREIATHGTGCTFSAAITVGLASGLPLGDSIKRAKEFVTRSIRHHWRWKTKSGKDIHALNHSI